jgi:hypothetical protein
MFGTFNLDMRYNFETRKHLREVAKFRQVLHTLRELNIVLVVWFVLLQFI